MQRSKQKLSNIQKFIEILDLEKMNFNCIKKDSEFFTKNKKTTPDELL
jgi:hypothetical protein